MSLTLLKDRNCKQILYYSVIAALIIALAPAKVVQAEGSLRELARNHYLRARGYYRQGEYSRAQQELQEVLKLEPEHQGARWYLKSVEKELNKYKKPRSSQRRVKASLDSRPAVKPKYKQSLQSNFTQKVGELNQKLDSYESNVKQYEAKVKELERTTQKQLEETRLEKMRLEAELARMRQEKQPQIKQAEEEKQELDDELKHLQEAKQTEAEEPLSRRIERAEMRLVELQMKINEQLQAQIDGFKKEKAKSFYQQGLEHLKNKKYELARENFDQALSVYPDYTDVKRVLKNSKVQEKANLHLAEGKYNYKEKDYERAEQEFNQALALDYKNEEARDYLRKIEKELKQKRRTEALLAKQKRERLEEARARLEEKKRRAQQQAVLEAWKKAKKEQARKAKEEELARRQAEKEQKLARIKAAQENRLKAKRDAKLQRRKAKEDKLAKRQAEKKEKLARRQAEKEQKLARIKAEEERLAKRRAEKEQKLARIKAEKERRLKLKQEAQAQRRKQARLKKIQARRRKKQARLKREQARKARAEELARRQAEKEQHLEAKRQAQVKRSEELRLEKEKLLKLRLENEAKKLALKESELKAKAEQLRLEREKLAKGKAEKEERLKARREERRLLQEQASRDKALQRAQAKLAERARREAQEEKLRLKRQAQARRERQAQLKKMQARKANAQRRKAEQERLAQLKAEKEERLKARREEQAQRRKQAQLEKEQARHEKERQRQDREKAEKELEKKIELHYAYGKKHFSNKDYIAARKEFKDILFLDPGNKYALNALDKLDATIAKEEKEAARQRQRTIDKHLGQGKVYFHQEKYQAAIAEFGKILLFDPNHSLAEKYILRCKKESEAARRQAQARLEEEKRQRAEEERLAKLRQEKKAGRLEKTAKVIKEEKEEEKLREIKDYYQKGKSYLQRGLYSEAIACFEKVIELEGNPSIYYTPQAKELIDRAKTEKEEKKKEDAQEIAEEEVARRQDEEAQKLKAQERAQQQAQRKEEQALRQHYKAGKKYYRQGNYPLAIAEFNKVKEINPEHPYASYGEKYIAKSQQKIIQREEAELIAGMKSPESDLAKGEVSGESLLKQARWYYKRGDYTQAAKVCRAALEFDPLDKRVRNLLYEAELRQAKQDKRQADREMGIDEKEMMAEVAELQVLPDEKTAAVEERFIPILKVPAIREKLKTPIAVDFRDVDLTYVLNFLADACGVNIIAASGVSLEEKQVTIRMKDVPVENALKYILKNQGLTYRIEEDAVWVASPAEMDKEEVESRVYFLNRGLGMFTEFERTVAAGTGLGGAAAISKITTIKDVLGEAVDWPKNSKLVLDERSGALIIANTPVNLKIIEDILYNLDITPVQVLIEARFVELEVTDVEELGIEWKATEDWGLDRSDGANVGQLEENAGWDFTSFSRASEGLNLTYTGVLTYPQYQAVVHALSETQNAKTLSAPRVSTLNNQRASIKVVDEWIYPTRYEFQVVQSDINGDGDFDDANETTYSNVPVDFVTKDVGILLHVTPNIGADGKTITLALVPEVSEGTAGFFSYTGSVSLPKFTSRTLSTSVVINNGETVALGGLVKESTTKTVTKVPILGDIPILGHFFRKKTDSIVRKNLLIFVTASIISPSGERIETVQQQ